jgi:hypothetical protein
MNVVERNLSLVSFIIRLIWRNEEAAPAVYQKKSNYPQFVFLFFDKTQIRKTSTKHSGGVSKFPLPALRRPQLLGLKVNI